MEFLQWWVITLFGLFQLYAAGHALLYKRDPKASWAWILFVGDQQGTDQGQKLEMVLAAGPY